MFLHMQLHSLEAKENGGFVETLHYVTSRCYD